MVTFLIWVMVSILLFTITLFVHRHTYDTYYDGEIKGKTSMPLWFFLLLVLAYCIPILNLLIFAAGMILYFVAWANKDITMNYTSNWYMSLSDWLNKEVN